MSGVPTLPVLNPWPRLAPGPFNPDHGPELHPLRPGSGGPQSRKGERNLPLLCSVTTVAGPMARDVESLALCLRALLSEDMHRLDPTVPFMPFREEVSWVGEQATSPFPHSSLTCLPSDHLLWRPPFPAHGTVTKKPLYSVMFTSYPCSTPAALASQLLGVIANTAPREGLHHHIPNTHRHTLSRYGLQSLVSG